VLDRLDGFDWDDANVDHILRHNVLPSEVEAAVRGKIVIVPALTIDGENRWRLYGKAGGRYLVVIFTVRLNRFRTVTAHDMNRSERKRYASQID
jgi:uncharacterized DUF497 family protein